MGLPEIQGGAVIAKVSLGLSLRAEELTYLRVVDHIVARATNQGGLLVFE